MKQLLIPFLCVIMILFAMMLPGCINNDTTKHISILETNERFERIQDAIDHADNGQTVLIPAGVFHESIVIDKQITLSGENMKSTILDGSGFNDVIYVVADNVTLNGFSIRDLNNINNSDDDAGVDIRSESNHISYINFSENANYGIYLNNAHFNQIEHCQFYNNGEGGIYSYYSNNNSFENNSFLNSSHGLFLFFNHDGKVVSNKISSHSLKGLYFYACRYHLISDNIFSKNERGINIKGSKNNTITENMITQNNIGIYLCCSGIDNLIYKNVFLTNEEHAHGYPLNQFDNGTVGNYWDDYNGVDADGDGIGDQAYNVTAGVYGEKNVDHFPLITLS